MTLLMMMTMRMIRGLHKAVPTCSPFLCSLSVGGAPVDFVKSVKNAVGDDDSKEHPTGNRALRKQLSWRRTSALLALIPYPAKNQEMQASKLSFIA